MRLIKYFLLVLVLASVTADYSHASQDKSVDAYKKAADQYHKIKKSPKKTTRADLEKSLAKFKGVYTKYPGGSKSPQALYMSGSIYADLFRQYHKTVDKDNAITIYRVFVRSYQNNPLANNALYDSGELHLLENKKLEALSDFRGVLRWFPKSESATKAKIMVARLEREVGKSKSGGKKIVPEAEGADFKGVRYWGNSKYTRVVFEVGKSVHYRASSNAEGNGITVDLLDVENPADKAKLLKPLEIFVESIQISKLNNEIMRAMIRLNSKCSFTTFVLSNPERIVVDINAAKPAVAAVNSPELKVETTETENPAEKPVAEKKGERQTASLIPRPDTSLPMIEPLSRQKTATTEPSPPAERQTASLIPRPDTSLPMIEPLPSGMAAIPKSPTKKGAGESTTIPSTDGKEASLHSNPKSDKIRTIVIDPGHGGKDPGAIGRNGLKEKDITLDVALRLKKQIQTDCRCKVLMTRSTDVFIPLDERTAFANTVDADLFISIHVNSNKRKSAKGVETYFLSPARSKNESYVAARENMIQQENDNEDMNDLAFILFDMQNTDKINESSRMAGTIQRSLAGKLGSTYRIKNNGVKQAMFYVLHGAKMPSILVETSFISNPAEEKLLKSSDYKDTIALGIARGVADYAKETQMAWYYE
jgi:N-acetylmuramoyl-L-alanine amidase